MSKAETTESLAQTEYLSFDYQYHQHLSQWNKQSWCLPVTIATAMTAVLVVLFLAPIVGFCILGVSVIVALVISYGPTSQRLALLSQARRVRLEIKSQPGLSGKAGKTFSNNKETGDLEVKLRKDRDWSKASGWYQPKKHSDMGKIALEFVPFDSVFLKTGNTVWSVGGGVEE